MCRRGTFAGFLCAVLVLMGVLMCVPLGANATETPESYNLWVGGVQVTSANAGGITGDGITGTVSYDRGTRTLTLSGAAITGVAKTHSTWDEHACIYTTEDLRIVLVGNNTLDPTVTSGNGRGIYAKGSDSNNRITLTISGEGSLETTGTFQGIYGSDCDVVIAGGTVTSQTQISADNLSVQGGMVTATSNSDNCFYVTNSISISAGSVTATSNSRNGISAQSVTITGGTVRVSGGGSYGILAGNSVSLGGSAHVEVRGTTQAFYGTLAETTGYCRTSESGAFTETISASGTYFEYVGPEHLSYTQNSDKQTHNLGCAHGITIGESELCSGGDATCTVQAQCTKCGSGYGALLDHSTGEAGDRAATCEAKAYCSVCKNEYGEYAVHKMESTTGKCQYGCGLDMAVASVSAGETATYYQVFKDALNDWKNGTTLTLLADIPKKTVTDTIQIEGKTVTLDLNGHTLDMSDVRIAIQVGRPNGATTDSLTIRDGSAEKKGELIGEEFAVVVDASLCLESGNLTGSVLLRQTFCMKGGSVKADYNAINVESSATFEISGGKLQGRHGIWNNGRVTISGDPEITGRDLNAVNPGAAVANVSGTMTVSGTPTLSGGAHGDFFIKNPENPVTFLTQPGEGESWSVWMETPGVFAEPGEDAVLDAEKFTSKKDGCIVVKQADGSLALKKRISDGDVTLSRTEFTYDGTVKKPTVSVTWGGATLTQATDDNENADYTVTWENENSTNADTYSVTIKGINEYTGEVVKEYTIGKATLVVSQLTYTGPNASTLTYDGNAKTATVTGNTGLGAVTVLYQDSEGNRSSEAPVDAGTYQVVVDVAESQNYEAATGLTDNSWTFTIAKATPAAIGFPSASSIVYGQKLEESKLTGGSGDGSFAWVDADTVLDAGMKMATVAFVPRDKENYDYTGINLRREISVTVEQASASVSKAPVAGVLAYNGSEQTLITAGVPVGGRMVYSLTENGTYSEAVPKGKAAGDYTVWHYVQADDSGNYKNSAKQRVDVTMAPKGLTVTSVKVQDKAYDGTTAATLKAVVLSGICGNDEVAADFGKCEVAFNDANAGTNKGIALTKAALKGADAGNYRIAGGYYGPGGSITPKAITPTVTGVADRYDETGSAIQPVVTVKDGNTLLKAGTDYSVSYGTNVSGTGKVTVTLKGNYSGKWEKVFAIDKVPVYQVKIGTVKNGSLQVTPSEARKGQQVTITATPWSGYSLQTLTVKDGDGKYVTIYHGEGGKFVFTMPGGDVTVAATFASNYVADDTNPKTGDRIAVAVGVMAVSAMALAAAFVIWKKRKK